MSKLRPPYPAEFLQQKVALVRAGRSTAQLSPEFGVTAQSITNWFGQAAIDHGKLLPGKEDLTTAEREELVRLRRQLRQIRMERDILARATAWFASRSDRTPTKSSEFVMASQADRPVCTMCRFLGASVRGFYILRERAPSQRSIANAVVTDHIRQIHQDSYESYGMPRVWAELIEQGVCISRQRVARLMRQAGIHGISKRRGFTISTCRDKRQTPASDIVNRRFHAIGPNQLWVAGMTYALT